MKRSFVQILSTVLIAVLLITAFGCYGSFQLTNKVYKFNGTLGSKWVNELGFLVMVIVPVYGVAAAVDGIVLNSIEFWTGKNPMTANNETRTISLPQGSMALNSQDNSYTFKQMIDGKEQFVQVVTENGVTTATNEAGTILARSVKNAEGGVTVTDGNGNLVSTLTKAQVESMVASK
jgi:hypothetical protein